MSNMKRYNNKISEEEYSRFFSLLQNIRVFMETHPNMSYIEFDYYVVHDITLFTVEPNLDFEELESNIYFIKKAIPALRRIFNKPIIILKDSEDVLPVENVRAINQNTLLHLANHCQYVSDITKRGVKPTKLLTHIYEDYYGIYENVVFCNLIDWLLLYISKNRKILNNLLYSSNIIEYSLLDKINHVNYFLALGKLHTGYIRDFSQYFGISKKILSELSQVSQAINSKLNKPVYQKNLKRNRKVALKKTYIFLMQKDYRQVYKTYKYLLKNQVVFQEKEIQIDYELLNQNYYIYVQILLVFALGHFNFDIAPNTIIDLNALNILTMFKGWEVSVITNNNQEIFINFFKDVNYRVLILSNMGDYINIDQYKNSYGVDEVIFVSQFEENYLKRDDVLISIEDIDSFRRIQQILLRGMIYSDISRDICPFCGEKLSKDKYHNIYLCSYCMTQIKESICPETQKIYFYTDIKNYKKRTIYKLNYNGDSELYYKKQIDASMHFRNITRINHNAEIICPHCNKIHNLGFDLK